MKKVRAGQLARSASRIGKTSSRFQFDITVDKVSGVKNGQTYFVKWVRGVKVASTQQQTATKEHSRGGLSFDKEKISLLVTLYREGNSRNFVEKDSKLSLILVNQKKQERTVAKLHFNLADFAGVPSASTSKTFKLSDKVSIRAVVDCRFVKSGKAGPGSGGGNSALSGITGVSGLSSEPDEFDDLNIDDVPEPVPYVPGARPKRGVSGSLAEAPSKRGGASDTKSRRSNSSLTESSSRRNKRDSESKSKRGSTTDSQSRSKRDVSGSDKRISNGDSEPASSKRSIASTISDAQSMRSMDVSDRPRRGTNSRELPDSRSKRSVSSLNQNELKNKRSGGFGGLIKSPSRKVKAQRETQEELDKLRSDYEQVNEELRRAQDKRRRMETAHQEELSVIREKIMQEMSEVDQESSAKLASRIDELQAENSRLKAELEEGSREQESLRQKAADVEKLQRKTRDLSVQLDKATAAAAAASMDGDSGAAVSALEERLAKTRKEKDLLENKVKAHKAHAEKVRDTYEKLSGLYSSVREENIQMQQDLESARASASAAAKAAEAAQKGDPGNSAATSARVVALQAQLAPLQSQLRSANARAQDSDAAKVKAEAELGRAKAQLTAVQSRLDKSLSEVQTAKVTEEDLHSEIDELKSQRDAALERALSKRDSKEASRGGEEVAATLGKIREDSDREIAKARSRAAELEEEVMALTEDVHYEKSEKLKAREERDALRENVRSLERRTSEAILAQDSVSALRRKLSTQVMREEDLNSMVSELRAEVKRHEEEASHKRQLSRTVGNEDVSEILGVLVKTKLELAQAEDEKLELHFQMKQLKKAERAIQERLAAHASSLEVKLGQTREQLDSLKGSSPLSTTDVSL